MQSKTNDSRWWVLAAVGTGSFMTALDSSIVNILLPVIQENFHTRIAAVEWIVTVYLLILSGLLLSFGRLGDLRGHKTVYLWGFGIFVASSAACGAAPAVEWLILFRGLQAVGGAMLAANAPAILTANFPSIKRGQALGLASMMTYLGLTVGPSLGGWLAHTFTWRVVFYVNIPVGALALILSLVCIPPSQVNRVPGQKFDLAGALLFLTGLSALLLGLNQGASWGWGSVPILVLLGSSLLITLIFIRVELDSASPILDMSLFRVPLFTTATASAVLNYICIYSIMFLMPFYLINGRGLNSAMAGMLLTAQPIVMAIAAPVSGAYSDRIGSRIPGMVGMGVMATGLFLMAFLDADSPLIMAGLALAVAGLGTGTFISPNTSALMGAAPKERQGIASAVQATARNVGMVLGIGMAGAILTTQMARGTPASLFSGIKMGFATAGVVALLGVVMSAIKEK